MVLFSLLDMQIRKFSDHTFYLRRRILIVDLLKSKLIGGKLLGEREANGGRDVGRLCQDLPHRY
jgi:hypothetical protein